MPAVADRNGFLVSVAGRNSRTHQRSQASHRFIKKDSTLSKWLRAGRLEEEQLLRRTNRLTNLLLLK